MTDKELLNQFDAMCKEWYGKNGYTEVKDVYLGEDYDGLGINYIDRVGFINTDCDKLWIEPNAMCRLYLSPYDSSEHYTLCVSLFAPDVCDNIILTSAILNKITHYFDVMYLDDETEFTDDVSCLYFRIKEITNYELLITNYML